MGVVMHNEVHTKANPILVGNVVSLSIMMMQNAISHSRHLARH
jgi:hypothetical protein